MKKKVLAMLLAAVMVMALLPTAFAADSDFVIEDGWLIQYTGSDSEVRIPDGITGILAQAFEDCDSVTSVIIPGSVEIGSQAFYGCNNLTSVTILTGVTSIVTQAFFMCPSLTSITIPASVTHIEWEAFDCENLTDVYYGGSESQWGEIIAVGWFGMNSTFAEGGQNHVGLQGVKVHYNSTIPEPTEPEPAEPETPEITFPDVPSNAYYADAVAWAVKEGYVTGKPNGLFEPLSTCSEAEILRLLYNVYSPTYTGEAPFADSLPDYCRDAVNWAYENNMISDSFQYTAPCTRATTIYFLWLANGAKSPAGEASFPDVNADDYYADAVAWAEGEGIVSGNGSGLFDPGAIFDRGMVATLVYKTLVPEART